MSINDISNWPSNPLPINFSKQELFFHLQSNVSSEPSCFKIKVCACTQWSYAHSLVIDSIRCCVIAVNIGRQRLEVYHCRGDRVGERPPVIRGGCDRGVGDARACELRHPVDVGVASVAGPIQRRHTLQKKFQLNSTPLLSSRKKLYSLNFNTHSEFQQERKSTMKILASQQPSPL